MPSIFYLIVAIIFILIFSIYIYWRYFFFFRDPERDIPGGNNIVAPAEGTIVYVNKIEGDKTPIIIKNNKEILLEEIFKIKDEFNASKYHIGIFMHPTSVHVNRAPISGIIYKILYTPSKNLPMTMMWWRVLLKMRPFELYSQHVFQNERNTILFKGTIPVFIVQIADILVNKIDCWVKEQDEVKKGQRVGMIKMGSQVDILFPSEPVLEVLVKVGQKVVAGETILASLK